MSKGSLLIYKSDKGQPHVELDCWEPDGHKFDLEQDPWWDRVIALDGGLWLFVGERYLESEDADWELRGEFRRLTADELDAVNRGETVHFNNREE